MLGVLWLRPVAGCEAEPVQLLDQSTAPHHQDLQEAPNP